jgi:hypothetical protein
MDIFNLLIDNFPYYGETLADRAKKRQLLPHLEAFIQHLEAWRQEEHQSSKDREKYCVYPLLYLIPDGYESLGNAEKNANC